MNEKEFNRIFGQHSETDTISIKELRDILITPAETDPRVTEFLDTKIINYEFPKTTKQLIQLGAMIKTRIRSTFGVDVTFREILEKRYFPDEMRKERQVGAGILRLLMDTYRENGVTDIYKYYKN